MKLEKMDAFFTARLNGYDEHMMTEIRGAKEFYPYTAAPLPFGKPLTPCLHADNLWEIFPQRNRSKKSVVALFGRYL